MRLRRPEHPERVAVVAAVALVVVNVAIFGTLKQQRGSAPQKLRGAIVTVDPQQGENILPQASISAQVLPRYTGQFTIDGRAIPQDQVESPSLYLFVFQPKTGHDITQFRPGAHNASFEAWPANKTYEEARRGRLVSSYSWRFNVG